MNVINVNSNNLVRLTDKLEKLGRSNLPLAVRSTLNDAAFDMKTKKIQPIFNQKFTTRKKNFIRSHTAFNKSPNTFNLAAMNSHAGIIRGKSNSGDELVNQEFSGTIKNREYIATEQARIGKSKIRTLSRKNRLLKVKPPKYHAKSFMKSAYKVGVGGIVFYKKWIFRIDAIRKGKIKSTPLYIVNKTRSVKIKRTPFLAPASQKTAKEIDNFFIKNANYRLKKYYS